MRDKLFLFQVLQEDVGMAQLVQIFCTEGYNKNAKLHYLGPLLSNLTQLPEARNYLMDKDRWLTSLLVKSSETESGRLDHTQLFLWILAF